MFPLLFRRRSLYVKILILIPASWFLVTLLSSFSSVVEPPGQPPPLPGGQESNSVLSQQHLIARHVQSSLDSSLPSRKDFESTNNLNNAKVAAPAPNDDGSRHAGRHQELDGESEDGKRRKEEEMMRKMRIRDRLRKRLQLPPSGDALHPQPPQHQHQQQQDPLQAVNPRLPAEERNLAIGDGLVVGNHNLDTNGNDEEEGKGWLEDPDMEMAPALIKTDHHRPHQEEGDGVVDEQFLRHRIALPPFPSSSSRRGLCVPMPRDSHKAMMRKGKQIPRSKEEDHNKFNLNFNDVNTNLINNNIISDSRRVILPPPPRSDLLRRSSSSSSSLSPVSSSSSSLISSVSTSTFVNETSFLLTRPRPGVGELGKPVQLPKQLSPEVQRLVDKGWTDNAFNQYISDMISLQRRLPDVRDPKCADLRYQTSSLPATSVIICFHNEAWSVLLRTIHSVLDRSPSHLISEIILVDDFSDKPHLGKPLEDYISRWGGKVKIIRAAKREGLIRARLLGFEIAKGPVLTYLDSHCECTEGWLEPLLDRIAKDSRTVVCPVIDVISDKTFEYHFRKEASSINVGGFDWNLQFNWHAVPEKEKKRLNASTDAVRSPTMAGGLFSISKDFFQELGTYDSGFDIWGGENLELSFKTWMCGGTLEIVPCSHVGHIFRSRSPYKWRTGVNVLKKNSIRLAEVWMDDYKKYYYQRIGNDLGDFGDVSDRIALRNRLKCHSFGWYIKNIYPELFVPGEAVASGEIRNLGSGPSMCLDSGGQKKDLHKPVGLYPCHGQGGNQYWLLSREGEIRRDEACLDYSGKDVILYPCHGSKGNQLWLYDHRTGLIRHGSSGKCLEMSSSRDRLWMRSCESPIDVVDARPSPQRWTMQNFNPDKFTQLA